MIARIIKAEVCVICRSRRLRRITQTEALIILAIMRKPNTIIVLLCIHLSTSKDKSAQRNWSPYSTSTCKQLYFQAYNFPRALKLSSKVLQKPYNCKQTNFCLKLHVISERGSS